MSVNPSVKGGMSEQQQRYAEVTLKFPVAPLPSAHHSHRHHIPTAELQQQKGVNCVPDTNARSRSNTGSSREQCPPPTAQSIYSVPID